MTDSGSCYRSGAFAVALEEIKHVRTGPYRAQTQGKVERFNRTLAEESATPPPASVTKPAPRPTRAGCTTAIITDRTLA
jgi:transposase InsO family protein